MSSYWVRLGGKAPATEVAQHGPPTWETLADGGTGTVSLTFSMSAFSLHPLLAEGTRLEVMYGAEPVATARVTEYDRNTGDLTGLGLSAHAHTLMALAEDYNPTRNLGLAINVATTWNWGATNPRSVGGIVAGTTDEPVYLGDLFNQRAAELGARWGVDGRGEIYMRSDPTLPTYVITPGAAAFGTTDDETVSHLVGRYWDATTGVQRNLIWPPSGVVKAHEYVDLRERGPISVTEVGLILGGLLAVDMAVTSWTNAVELRSDQIRVNGEPADLGLITAGEMARATGFSAELSDAPYLDVVIGKTRYTAGADSIYLEPTNKAPRTHVEGMSE